MYSSTCNHRKNAAENNKANGKINKWLIISNRTAVEHELNMVLVAYHGNTGIQAHTYRRYTHTHVLYNE